MKRMQRKLINLSLGLVMVAMLMSVGSVSANSPPKFQPVPMPPLSELPWEYEHRVRPGEYLFMLAGYYYQDYRKWNWIYETNLDKIRVASRIYTGQVLTIRLPRGWEPPMPYGKWYDRNKEQRYMFAKKGLPPGAVPLSILQPASGF